MDPELAELIVNNEESCSRFENGEEGILLLMLGKEGTFLSFSGESKSKSGEFSAASQIMVCFRNSKLAII